MSTRLKSRGPERPTPPGSGARPTDRGFGDSSPLPAIQCESELMAHLSRGLRQGAALARHPQHRFKVLRCLAANRDASAPPTCAVPPRSARVEYRFSKPLENSVLGSVAGSLSCCQNQRFSSRRAIGGFVVPSMKFRRRNNGGNEHSCSSTVTTSTPPRFADRKGRAPTVPVPTGLERTPERAAAPGHRRRDPPPPSRSGPVFANQTVFDVAG